MKRGEFEEFAREMRARQTVQEAFLHTFIAHVAAHFDEPVRLVAQVVGDVEQALRNAYQHAPEAERQTAANALQVFERFSGMMLAQVNIIAPPAGRG